MNSKYCFLILTICAASVYCKVLHPAEDAEEDGPNRALHEANLTKEALVEETTTTTIISTRPASNDEQSGETETKSETKKSVSKKKEEEKEDDEVIATAGPGETLDAPVDDGNNSGNDVCVEIEIEHMHGTRVMNKGVEKPASKEAEGEPSFDSAIKKLSPDNQVDVKWSHEYENSSKEGSASSKQEDKNSNESEGDAEKLPEKPNTNAPTAMHGLLDFFWTIFNFTPSKKEIEEKNKEIDGDNQDNSGVCLATSEERIKEEAKEKEKEKAEAEEKEEKKEEKKTSDDKEKAEAKKSETEATESMEKMKKKHKSDAKRSEEQKEKKEAKNEETKTKKEKQAEEKKVKPQLILTESRKIEEKHEKQEEKSYADDYTRFSDELMKSDIVDSDDSSDSSSSEMEKNEKGDKTEKTEGEDAEKKSETPKRHRRHHEEAEQEQQRFTHYGIIKTLALVTAGPALIIAVVVLLSRAHTKKRDSAVM